ncbi:MAG: RDD family protein [Acidimicrobiia bacterium]|nr:RDD family protein [Acidimicrobiia bacterium]
MKPAPPEATRLGQYAGPATRVAAYLVDMGISLLVFAVSVSVGAFLINLMLQTDLNRQSGPGWAWTLLIALWEWLYFGGSWAASGKTPGMALLGLRVVDRDGGPLDPWRGIVRAPALALSFLTFGIGFVGIIIGKQHRALQDVLAGTVVVYDWDARTARLRFLARRPTLPESSRAQEQSSQEAIEPRSNREESSQC